MFGYEMVRPMDTGAEAVQTALKFAGKWAHMKKDVPEGQAVHEHGPQHPDGLVPPRRGSDIRRWQRGPHNPLQ
ncbi:hypothetical protein B0H16DRAFT_1319541 [Mycena metata]|uniref:Uncharacterized protein n=1 Tax=Mycena metata TaxID=1033252 RepID=A0AAD7IRV6_9AGAR|nr:hypothetical protein B0H16DRAFT_1319541 [Mycena metata]